MPCIHCVAHLGPSSRVESSLQTGKYLLTGITTPAKANFESLHLSKETSLPCSGYNINQVIESRNVPADDILTHTHTHTQIKPLYLIFVVIIHPKEVISISISHAARVASPLTL